MSQGSQLEELFYKDTADAFRVFDTMEHFLCQPEYLRGQIQVQLGSATQVRREHFDASTDGASDSTCAVSSSCLVICCLFGSAQVGSLRMSSAVDSEITVSRQEGGEPG